MSEKEMKKLDQKAKVAVLAPLIIMMALSVFLSSCAASYCPYAAKNKRTKNLCPAYR